ncbi:regulator of chromosome condensation 1/beta-lactamase-inhibitor protein II [Thamnocephalis sphaerospora]|uniref:Regulator of chromosome condensation 1/beta-lactamase-inhibitor protein II n=1 Tax=Thamnocephalis sphaerospora TaxID=78915 RepID=A0A4P9XR91_9FUNG|nr:regulator of chromosome condensation 1/beta-lactamase-inhibitor protein II [Thamnocephalis sphaerospora]|eukprot:RKP07830.1 regulator of chromosome condensation 1/beta-lactamase-inhibitor protein II [Thamnocephalis sphaerospora]
MLRAAVRLSGVPARSRAFAAPPATSVRRALHGDAVSTSTSQQDRGSGNHQEALSAVGGAYMLHDQWSSGQLDDVVGRAQQLVSNTLGSLVDDGRVHAEARVSMEESDDTLDAQSDSTLLVDRRTTTDAWDTRPACFAWGSNEYRVVAPELPSTETVREPRPLLDLDGQALRDVALGREHAVAVDARGNLYQWGSGFDGAREPSDASAQAYPTCTLSGQRIKQLAVRQVTARHHRLCSLADAANPHLHQGSSASGSRRWWWPFGGQASALGSTIGYAALKLDSAASGERVCAIAAGDQHVVALTTQGRVFSASVAELTAEAGHGSTPAAWNATLHLVPGLEREQTAHGDAFTWGDNHFGQLGLGPYKPSQVQTAEPRVVATLRRVVPQENGPHLPAGRVIDIAAGGHVSYFVVAHDGPQHATQSVYACGGGQQGQLGTGQFTQVQGTPVRLRTVSGLTESGSTHTALVLDTASGAFGRDVLMWGQRQHAQCGAGQRGASALPTRPASWTAANAVQKNTQPEKTPVQDDMHALTGQAVDRLQTAPARRVQSAISQQHHVPTADAAKVRTRELEAEQMLRVGYRTTLLFDQVTQTA